MKRYIYIYLIYCQQYFKILLEYRVDFVLSLFSFMINQISNVIFLVIIFNNIQELNGWNFNEMILLFSIFQITRGIDHLVTDNLWSLPKYVIRGEFDRFLLRPINPLFALISEKVEMSGLGELALGIYLLNLANYNLGTELLTLRGLMVMFMFLGGAMIYSMIKLLAASISFWVKDSSPLIQVMYELSNFSQYPMDIYPKFLKDIFIYFIPYYFTAFFPMTYLLGEDVGGNLILTYYLIVCVLTLIALNVWKSGIKRYESSGA